MKDFAGKLAVITGAGSGMGRELARQLSRLGCRVALCDVQMETLQETRALCSAEAPAGTRISISRCDVSDERSVEAFRDDVKREHATDRVQLLFNNAGIGGGGSFVRDARSEWEQTFNVCWGGVYLCTRAFMPLLIASEAAHIVNVSSVNGFWASLGPSQPHTAYSAAKFAVKGFSEALVIDLRVHAPHVLVSVVMPGHIGTSIFANSQKLLHDRPIAEMSSSDLAPMRATLKRQGIPADSISDDALRAGLQRFADDFRDKAPTSAAEAAKIMIDGVRDERWRILVGADAQALDAAVRAAPEDAYEPAFAKMLAERGFFRGIGNG